MSEGKSLALSSSPLATSRRHWTPHNLVPLAGLEPAFQDSESCVLPIAPKGNKLLLELQSICISGFQSEPLFLFQNILPNFAAASRVAYRAAGVARGAFVTVLIQCVDHFIPCHGNPQTGSPGGIQTPDLSVNSRPLYR